MIEQNGETYVSSPWAKALNISEAKIGKTCFEVATALGVMPNQKQGGIVTKPSDLHIIATDSNSLGGVKRFLIESCGARREALGFRVYNIQADIRAAFQGSGGGDEGWGMDLYNLVVGEVIPLIQERVAASRGVSLVLLASLTGLAGGLERALVGEPRGPGYSDPSKWKALAHHLHEIQNLLQPEAHHMIWEAHLDKPPPPPMADKGGDNRPKEGIRVSGEAGRNFAFNCEQVFRLRRTFGLKWQGTPVDQTYLDTRPSLEFIANGRNFTEALDPKEYDPTKSWRKLGLKVGHWGAPSAPPKAAKPGATGAPPAAGR